MGGTIRLAFAKKGKRPHRLRHGRGTAAACAAQAVPPRTPASEPAPIGGYDGLRAVTSLSRALEGNGTIEDAGALAWIILRQIIASDAMALFLPDGAPNGVRALFATGLHADRLRGQSFAGGRGIAGWVFEELLPALNANPALDFDAPLDPPLRSSLAIPLIDGDALAGVLVLYRASAQPYTDADQRLLELLAPRLAAAVLDSAPIAQPTAPVAPSASPLRLVKG